MSRPVLYWFRNDFRLADNPSLTRAAAEKRPIVPVFLAGGSGKPPLALGAASRWWMHHSVDRLATDLAAFRAPLVIRSGHPATVLAELAEQTGATHLFASQRFEPAARQTEDDVRSRLGAQGVDVAFLNGSLLHDPTAITTKAGKPYRVFSPFWRTLQAEVSDDRLYNELPRPQFDGYDGDVDSLSLDDLNLLPKIAWDTQFYDTWTPGEAGAKDRLDRFLDVVIGGYDDSRNIPSVDGTSSLSPHLHFGEISPRQVARAVRDRLADDPSIETGAKSFLSEIGWRDFAHHVLYHFPQTVSQPLNAKFNDFPYLENAEELARWQRGQTGYPIVDAGMRQLWSIGWMHNRVRMIVGSFLTKHLLQPWWKGAEWFWDTLVDADLANNTLGWQWIGGTGADAAPYFRVFNPMSQGEKFDDDGEYIRRWVPELRGLSSDAIHQPWTASPVELEAAGVVLGETYPRPMVDHASARQRALDALEATKTKAG